MAKRKPKTIAKELNECAELMQKIVRLKAADYTGYCSCVTCGVRRHWSEMHGGHYIGRRWTATKIMEENIHPQCPRCNRYLSGNYRPYTLYMIDTYGREFVDELEVLKNETKKYTRQELSDIKQELKETIEKLREEKGL